MTLAVRLEEQELDELAIKLFTQHESQFTPRHPWILVRVLPREQFYKNLIILPDNKSQNKPVHEGIVLTTWKPYFKEWSTRTSDGNLEYHKALHTSEFVPGDHVCYPHWAGQVVPDWDERFYVCVPEQVNDRVGIDHSRCILGKLNYPRESVQDKLQDIIDDHVITAQMTRINKAVKLILEQFDVIPKGGYSKTTSGK